MSSSILLRVLLSVMFVLAILQVVRCQCEDYKSTKTTSQKTICKRHCHNRPYMQVRYIVCTY